MDVLQGDGQVLEAGPLSIRAHSTPGHTPACSTYEIGDAVFVGDLLFMPDFGTARCDFPGGSASVLYDSIQRLYALSDIFRVFTGHDHQPGGRELRVEICIAEQKASNKQLRADTPPPGIRGLPASSRCHRVPAGADAFGAPGQHPGRGDAAARRQRHPLPPPSAEPLLTGRGLQARSG